MVNSQHPKNHVLQNGHARPYNHVYSNSTNSTPERQRKTYTAEGQPRAHVSHTRLCLVFVFYTQILLKFKFIIGFLSIRNAFWPSPFDRMSVN